VSSPISRRQSPQRSWFSPPQEAGGRDFVQGHGVSEAVGPRRLGRWGNGRAIPLAGSLNRAGTGGDSVCAWFDGAGG